MNDDIPSCASCEYNKDERCALKGFCVPLSLSMNMTCKDYVKKYIAKYPLTFMEALDHMCANGDTCSNSSNPDVKYFRSGDKIKHRSGNGHMSSSICIDEYIAGWRVVE